MGSPNRRHRGARWGLLALAAALACEDAPAPEPPPAPAPSAEPTTVRPTPAPSPWPAEVRSLRESVAAFESVERCVAAMRERLPVEVAELFYDLGYDDALGEVCRSLEAAATGDAERCDSLVSSTVKRQCRTRVAALHEKPEVCPEALSRDGGRDPTCLAWASDDASLCDGAPVGDRTTCLAVATGDADRCDGRGGLRSAASCRALVTRLEGVVEAEAPPARPPAELVFEDAGDPPLRLPADAARGLDRGVVAAAYGCAHRVVAQVRPAIGDGRDVAGFTLALHLGGSSPSLGHESEVAVGRVETSYALRGVVTVAEETELRPGGLLRASFEATYLRDGAEHPVRGHVRTFFRDVAPLPDHCTD